MTSPLTSPFTSTPVFRPNTHRMHRTQRGLVALGLCMAATLACGQTSSPATAQAPWGSASASSQRQPAASSPAPASASPAPSARDIGNQVREALRQGIDPKQPPRSVTIEIPPPRKAANGRSAQATPAAAATPAPSPARPPISMAPLPPIHVPPGAIPNPLLSRQLRAQAATQAAQAPTSVPPPWDYSGAKGPQAWGQLHPSYRLCSQGQRQSPIALDDNTTLQGPAQAIGVQYSPSSASVLHTGRTLQVDVSGANSIEVRGATYRLQQILFHHPSEERINGKTAAMSAQLMHRNAEGQWAVVVVLLEPGEASAAINRIWTYLPLEVGDRVQIPAERLEPAGLLPQDMRYYQYLGSLTTPPCTEDVLRLVLKQPLTVSPEQLRLFAQLFPNNARPLQPARDRLVRNATQLSPGSSAP